MQINSQVKDFMSSPIVFINAEHILEQAEKIFHDNNLSTAPVLVDKKKVLGVITDFQLMKFFLMRNSNPSRARIKDYAEDLDPVFLIDENEPISNAFKQMVQSPNHRIYVTSNNALTGALSPKDILPFMAGEEAIDRHWEKQDLIKARIQIKVLLTELSKTQDQLAQYEQAFTSSPYMIHSVNLDGQIVMANRMIHSVLGYTEGELIGKNITDLYSSQFHQQARDGITRVKVTGFHPMINTLMAKKSKELIQVDIATAARTGPDGEVVGTITIGRISDSGKMLEALATIGRAIREADRAQED
ncbi:MAG: CBS domain-containing protein [Pseudobdellovibrionaceae bacterium]